MVIQHMLPQSELGKRGRQNEAQPKTLVMVLCIVFAADVATAAATASGQHHGHRHLAGCWLSRGLILS